MIQRTHTLHHHYYNSSLPHEPHHYYYYYQYVHPHTTPATPRTRSPQSTRHHPLPHDATPHRISPENHAPHKGQHTERCLKFPLTTLHSLPVLERDGQRPIGRSTFWWMRASGAQNTPLLEPRRGSTQHPSQATTLTITHSKRGTTAPPLLIHSPSHSTQNNPSLHQNRHSPPLCQTFPLCTSKTSYSQATPPYR